MSDGHGGPRSEPTEQTEPTTPNKKWIAVVVGLVALFIALAAYDLTSGVVTAGGVPTASAGASSVRAVPTSTSSVGIPPTVSPAASDGAAHVLSIATATAFGPDGTSDGDNPDMAPQIINGGDGQAWYSSWYTTPEFGNLQSGTGILLDMGETVTVSSVRLALGTPVGANVQVRVGNIPDLADLPAVASAYDVGGTIQLSAALQASGRYVLIWFTMLPPNSQGEYQVSLYGVTVAGTQGM